MKIKNKLLKTLMFCALLLLIVPTSCDNVESTDEMKIADIKSTSNFKSNKNKKITSYIKFNTVKEAEVFLQKLKNRKKEKYVIKFNKNSFSKDSFSFSSRKNAIKSFANRLQTSYPEETGWSATHGAGLFSNAVLTFNTTGNYVIDPGSINYHSTGTPIGWAYDQVSVTMNDADSFTIRGTMTWGISISGVPIPTSYSYDTLVRVDIDWNAGTLTFREL